MTTSARDMIAKWLWGYADRESRADAILEDLDLAGYRVIGPGQLDRETVEACAKVAERYQSFPEPTSRAARYHVKHCVKPNITAAIRALTVKQEADDGER